MNHEKAQLIAIARRMNQAGLNQGTSGNLSLRIGRERFLITPSAVAYDRLEPDDIVEMTLGGDASGRLAPSNEWRVHRDLYEGRDDAGAVLHSHSPWAMSVASLRRDLPPFHYMIMLAGGPSVRCAEYATYGTQELSDAVFSALERRRACLLANHGLLCLESSLERVFALAVEIETLCRVYLQSLAAGEPVLLSDEELATVGEKFASYGDGWKML
ncbi:MAG: class II aldolase/adducin family protein [Thermoanaerobaculia bacterium]|nr:class II aldolase/adducin family protein [Thermoanaerobaculia bacterium]